VNLLEPALELDDKGAQERHGLLVNRLALRHLLELLQEVTGRLHGCVDVGFACMSCHN